MGADASKPRGSSATTRPAARPSSPAVLLHTIKSGSVDTLTQLLSAQDRASTLRQLVARLSDSATPLHWAVRRRDKQILFLLHKFIGKGLYAAQLDDGRCFAHLLCTFPVRVESGSHTSAGETVWGGEPSERARAEHDACVSAVLEMSASIGGGVERDFLDTMGAGGDTCLHTAASSGLVQTLSILCGWADSAQIRRHTMSRESVPLCLTKWLCGGAAASRLMAPATSGETRGDQEGVPWDPLDADTVARCCTVIGHMIEKGGNVSLCDRGGNTPLHCASSCGSPSLLKHLLSFHANPLTTLKSGETPLHILASRVGDNFSACMALMLAEEKTASMHRDFYGCTPLLVACEARNIRAICALVERDARACSVANKQGKYAADMIEEGWFAGHEVVLQAIMRGKDEGVQQDAHSLLQLQIASDLHIEFGYDLSDVVVPRARCLALLGDIGVLGNKRDRRAYEKFLLRMAQMFETVLVVAGNHEYYGGVMQEVDEEIEAICKKAPNLLYLNGTSTVISGVQIFGGTMWTEVPEDRFADVQQFMNDYRKISFMDESGKVRRLGVEDTVRVHRRHLAAVEAAAAEAAAAGRPLLALTHHAPLTEFGFDEFSCADIDMRMALGTNVSAQLSSAHTWCYGHTHWYHDLRVGDTHVVSCPHGYPSERLLYDPSFTISIPSTTTSHSTPQ